MPARRAGLLLLAALAGPSSRPLAAQDAREWTPRAVVLPAQATGAQELAAREVRRYGALRTGSLLPLVPVTDASALPAGSAIVVGDKSCDLVTSLVDGDAELAATVRTLGAQDHLLAMTVHGGRELLLVTGGSPVGALYGAYRLAERLGVRFALHGDTLPDGRVAWPRIDPDELGHPLFELRGVLPFHDFPEGPDWWDRDDYLALLAQLPKLRMNFFGLHTYPEGGIGPEPTVWIGSAEDVGPEGRVLQAYPSRHFTTHTGQWGYPARDTDDYDFGAAALFARSDHGAEVMRGLDPLPVTPQECRGLFDDFGALLAQAFAFARELGVQTCIGTETPLTVPRLVRERLAAAGADPDDPALVQRLYEGVFTRIARTHLLDHYWLWTPEGWTWSGASEEDVARTVADLRAAFAAARAVKAPFALATCGWVLGPPADRTLFERVLPDGAALSCINRNVGFAPVEPGFARVAGRPKWAIPWLEDDPALILPQLWVGRMRRDAADAHAYGCTGLMGIHWRTRALGPNVAALAAAAWEQRGWNPDFGKEAAAPDPLQAEGVTGGKPASFPDHAIAGTEEDALYRSVLYDLDEVRLEVPDGACTVTLKFCEPHYREPGRRVFGVKLGGETKIERLDVFERVGADRALDFTFEGVPVSDGLLRVGFARIVEFPCIAALVVAGAGWERRIDCGGPGAGGYEPCPSRRGYPGWPRGRSRDAATGDFYADWALAEFGPETADEIAALFVALDGGPEAFSEGLGNTRLPRPSTWIGGPGGIRPDPRPWDEARADYAFVEELARLRPRIAGAGSLERFDYWLESFRYLRATGRVACALAAFEEAMKAVEAAPDPARRRRLARERALPLRVELVAAVAQAQGHLLATVGTRGAMGTVANWQQHLAPTLLEEPGRRLEAALGQPLPARARPGREYRGPARVFLPTLRTSVVRGEPLELDVIVLGVEPERAILRWAPLGGADFHDLPLIHVARGVYCVTLPPEATAADLEYHVEVTAPDTRVLRFPATAPRTNQTVVTMTP